MVRTQLVSGGMVPGNVRHNGAAGCRTEERAGCGRAVNAALSRWRAVRPGRPRRVPSVPGALTMVQPTPGPSLSGTRPAPPDLPLLRPNGAGQALRARRGLNPESRSSANRASRSDCCPVMSCLPCVPALIVAAPEWLQAMLRDLTKGAKTSAATLRGGMQRVLEHRPHCAKRKVQHRRNCARKGHALVNIADASGRIATLSRTPTKCRQC